MAQRIVEACWVIARWEFQVVVLDQADLRGLARAF